MTGVRGGLSRRIGVGVCATLALLCLGPNVAAAASEGGPCVRTTITPPRPALSQGVTVTFRLSDRLVSPDNGSGPGLDAVVLRASVSGPGRHTLPLVIEQSSTDPRLYRSRFGADRIGAWHTRVLVFRTMTDAAGSGQPLCYASNRFVVGPPSPGPTGGAAGRRGLAAIVLPIVAALPIVFGVVLLVMSGRRRTRKRAFRQRTASLDDPDMPTGAPGADRRPSATGVHGASGHPGLDDGPGSG
jgi:hypothetical protein